MHKLPTSFSVALGLCFILPLLNYFRDPPLGDFFGEWSSAMVMASGALIMVGTLPQRLKVNGALFAVPLVLLVLIAVQAALGRYAVYAADALFYCCYLGMFALVVLLGQHFRSEGLATEVTRRMAWAVIMVGLVNLAAQIAQLGRWDVYLQPWIVRLMDESVCGPYGNTGQRNQTSAIAWMAMLGTSYLAHERRMPRWLMLVLIALFMFSSALTISRMAWLFLALAAVGLLAFRTPQTGRLVRRLLLAGGLICAFALVTVGVSALMDVIEPTCKGSVARLIEGRGSTGIAARLDFLSQAVLVWSSSPWIGTGAGSLKGMAYRLLDDGQPQPLDTYAHNIVAQLLAEFGAVGALVLLLFAAACVVTLWRNRRALEASDALLVSWLGVLTIHSLLEYPLWYVHFLMFFGLSLGLLFRPQWRLMVIRVPARWIAGGLAVAALGVGALLFRDYQHLDRLMFLVVQKVENRIGSSPQVDALLARADAAVVIYRPQAEHMLGIATSLSRDQLVEKVAATERVLSWAPTPQTISRRVVLAVLANDLATARHHLRRLFLYFPWQAGDFVEQMRQLAVARPEELGMLADLIDEVAAEVPRQAG